MMLSRASTTILILLAVATVVGQSPDRRVQTEIELATELCRDHQDQQTRDLLLSANKQLVSSRLWQELINKAAAAYYGPSPNKALTIYDVAIAVASQLRSPTLLAATYYSLGRTHSSLNQLPLAIEAYEKSRANFEQSESQRDLIYILADLGALYFILEEYQKAKDCSEQSIALAEKLTTSNAPPGAWPDDYGRARALQTLADISLRNGDDTQAIAILETSLALYRQLNGKGTDYDYYVAGDLMALGRAYPAISDHANGLLYLNQALEIVKKLSDADMMASLLNSLGFLYMEQEDYSQAREYYERGLKSYVAENNQRESARLLLNLAVIEQRQSNYDQALRRFKSSLQAARATKLRDVEIAASEGIGVVLTAKKDFAGSIEILNQSFQLAKETGDKRREAEILWRSSQVYYAKQDYGQAVSLAERAASWARLSSSPKLAFLATSSLGESYAAGHQIEPAIQTLKQAIRDVEQMRYQVAGREEERQVFFENKVDPYHL
jgi:tetratricopeptide (TPR) repeat protein